MHEFKTRTQQVPPLPKKKLRCYYRCVKQSIGIKLITISVASILLLSGCDQVDQLKGSFLKSADNVKKQTEEVQNNLKAATDNVNRKIEKAQNVVDAIGDLQDELKK